MSIREVIGLVIYLFFYPFKINKVHFTTVYFHAPSNYLFEQIVKWFVKRDYRFLTIDEFYDIESGSKTNTGKSVFISFDDGRIANLALVEICEKYKVPITIFVTTDAIEKGYFWWDVIKAEKGDAEVERVKTISNTDLMSYVEQYSIKHNIERSSMTLDQLKMLNNNEWISIQAHTKTHAVLPMCSDLELEAELISSKETLEEWLNTKIEYFAYPCGEFSDREVNFLKESGYKAAFTTKQNYLTPGKDDLFRIPRMEMNCIGGGKYENLAKIIGAWQAIKK